MRYDNTGTFENKFGSSGTNNGQFDNPRGIAFDSSGNIYVVDSDNHRVQKFDSSRNYSSQFGSSGSSNGQFSTPTYVAIDSSDNIYVADGNNHRVQKFSEGFTTFSDGTSATTSATVTGLSGAKSYEFKVAAVNGDGTGSYSSVVTGHTTESVSYTHLTLPTILLV